MADGRSICTVSRAGPQHSVREGMSALLHDDSGTAHDVVRCPLDQTPIDVHSRFVMESTTGPIEHIKGRCQEGHPYCGPVFYVAEVPEERE